MTKPKHTLYPSYGTNTLTQETPYVQKRVVSDIQASVAKIMQQDALPSIPYVLSIFVEKEQTNEALELLEHALKSTTILPWDIILRVCMQAINKRSLYLQHNKTENIAELDARITRILSGLKDHAEMKQTYQHEISYLCGLYCEECGNIDEAFWYYESGVQGKHFPAYVSLSRLYTQQSDEQKSIDILIRAYQETNRVEVLHKLIRQLYKNNDPDSGYEWYYILSQRLGTETPPLILYMECIDSDEQLEELSKYIQQYLWASYGVPHERFRELLESAHRYIQEETQNIAVDIHNIEMPYDDIEGVSRYLWLMSYDITILRNHTFLDTYLEAIACLLNENTSATQEVLYQIMERQNAQQLLPMVSHSKTNTMPDSIFVRTGKHLLDIAKKFTHPSFAETQSQELLHLIEMCYAKYSIGWPDETEDSLEKQYRSVQKYSQHYDSIPQDIKDWYEQYIQQYDQQYGIFFRRYISEAACAGAEHYQGMQDMLVAHPHINALFWIEKIIHQLFPDSQIQAIMQAYQLDTLDENDAFLLGHLLFRQDSDSAIYFLAHYPSIFLQKEVMLLFAQWISGLSLDEQQDRINHLQTVLPYDIAVVLWDAVSEYATQWQHSKSLLLQAHIACMYPTNEHDPVTLFLQSAQHHGEREWFVGAGDVLHARSEYLEAMYVYEKALMIQETERVMQKMVECAILEEQFPTALRYLQRWIALGYNMSHYMLAYYVWQDKMYDASVHLTHMISNHIPLIDAPRDTMHLLWNRVEQTYHNVSRVDIHSIQKESYIYTSFVYYMLNQSMGKSQPDVLYAHVQIILNIIEQNKESEDIYEYIVQLLTPFMQNQAIKELAMYTQSERAIFCVVEYIKFLCHQIQFVLSEEESLENIEEHSDTAEKIVQETSRVLSHFPDFHLYQDELLDAGHTVFCHAAGYKAHEIPAFLSATKH